MILSFMKQNAMVCDVTYINRTESRSATNCAGLEEFQATSTIDISILDANQQGLYLNCNAKNSRITEKGNDFRLIAFYSTWIFDLNVPE